MKQGYCWKYVHPAYTLHNIQCLQLIIICTSLQIQPVQRHQFVVYMLFVVYIQQTDDKRCIQDSIHTC